MARRFVSSSSQALYNNAISAGLASASKAAINVFLKRTTSGSRIAAGSYLNSQNTFYALLGADGNLYIGFAAGDLTEYAYYSLSGTTMYNIGVDFDGTASGNSNRLKCYVDGTLISLTYNAAVGSSLSPNLVDWQIGRRGTGEYHDGDVALCGVWGGVTLGATAHANLASGATDLADYTTSQVGAWLMAETGSTDNAADSSGNGNTLTQTGSPIWVADPSLGGGGGVVIPVFMHHYRQQGIA